MQRFGPDGTVEVRSPASHAGRWVKRAAVGAARARGKPTSGGDKDAFGPQFKYDRVGAQAKGFAVPDMWKNQGNVLRHS